MFALTFPQPLATLVALGLKRVDTRPFSPAWRGVLAIHASAQFPSEMRQLCAEEPYRTWLMASGYPTPESLPLGAIVGFCYLEHAAVITKPLTLPETEPPCDLSLGRTVFLFSGAVPLRTPILLPDGMRLWRVPIPHFPWQQVAAEVMAAREQEQRSVPAAADLQVVEGSLWEVGGPHSWRVVTTSLAHTGKRAFTRTLSGTEALERYPWLPEWYEEQRCKGAEGVLVCQEESARLVLFPEESAQDSEASLPLIASGLRQLRGIQATLAEHMVMPIPGVRALRPQTDLRGPLGLIRRHLRRGPVTVVVGH